MLKSKYGNEIDNSLLGEDFKPTLGMISDPKIKFFLENLQPCKVDIEDFFGKKHLSLREGSMVPYDDFDFDVIEDIESLEHEELFVLPILPESLTRKVLFGSRNDLRSKLQGYLVKKVEGNYITISNPEDAFFFHSTHFISSEHYKELVSGLRKNASIPYLVMQRIADQVNQVF